MTNHLITTSEKQKTIDITRMIYGVLPGNKQFHTQVHFHVNSDGPIHGAKLPLEITEKLESEINRKIALLHEGDIVSDIGLDTDGNKYGESSAIFDNFKHKIGERIYEIDYRAPYRTYATRRA